MSTAESKEKNKQNCNAKKKKTLMIRVVQYLLGAFVSLATSEPTYREPKDLKRGINVLPSSPGSHQDPTTKSCILTIMFGNF